MIPEDLTVGELVELLAQYDAETPVGFNYRGLDTLTLVSIEDIGKASLGERNQIEICLS